MALGLGYNKDVVNWDSEVPFMDNTDRREEMIGGKIVLLSSPHHNHSIVSGNIHAILHNYLRGKKCRVFHENIEVHLTAADRYIPDLAVICDLDKIKGGSCYGAPDLVVEVLSPSTGRYDRTIKKETYARAGVREYWIVDPGNRVVEVYHPQSGSRELDGYYITPASLDEVDEKRRTEFFTEFRCLIFPDLTIRLDDIFADMLPQ